MGKKLWSNRVTPLSDWLLVRITDPGGSLLVAEKSGPGGKVTVSQGVQKKNHGIVVARGKGRRKDNGELVPMEEELRVGATILFMGNTKQRPDDFAKEMEEEGLWFVPGEAVVAVIAAAPSFASVEA